MITSEIRRFSDNLSGLREFVDVIRPVLEGQQKAESERSARDLLPLLLVADALETNDFKLTKEQRETFKQQFGGGQLKVEKVEVEENADNAAKASFTVSGPAGQRFLSALRRLEKSNYHSELLYRNTLIALVSAAEWFLSQILHVHFEDHPEAAGTRDKTLSLKELQAMDSVADARRYLVDLRVEEILRGSFEDWIAFLHDQLKLSMDYLSKDKSRIIEICQRRNLLVHNAGHVNQIYRNKVPEDLQEKTPPGGAVKVSQEYLQEAIDTFERGFILIAAELWKKKDPTTEARGNLLIVITFEHLLAQRWQVAEGLAYFLTQDRRLPERDQLVGQINYWQCLKWQDRFEEVREEVERADFSAKEEQYRLAQLALLDDETAFFELLPSVLEAGKIKLSDLKGWPLFRGMRDTETYKDRYGPSEDSQQVSIADEAAT